MSVFKRIKNYKSRFERVIITRTLNENLTNLAIFYRISIAALISGLGLWKIRKDITYTFEHFSKQIDLWVCVILNLEIVIIISNVVMITVENIIDHKNGNEKFEIAHYIKKHIGKRIETTPLVLYTVFYVFLASILILQLVLDHSNRDYSRFFLSVFGQHYLLNAELGFVSLVLNAKRLCRILNKILEEKFEAAPCVPIWINADYKTESGLGLHLNTSMNLQELGDVHWYICKYIAIINQTYKLRLFSIVIWIFYKLTFIPYLVALNLIKSYLENLTKELTNACLLCFHIAELLLLSLLAESTNNEMKQTRIILCKNLKFGTSNEDVKNIEILLQKFKVHKAEFRVLNLFTLNKPFILSMLGAVTTCMVIFVQLQDTLNLSQLL